MDLKELSPEIFSYETYEPNYYDRLEMWDVVKCDDRALEHRLEETAVGWCDASRLGVRPRSGLAAVMCEDSNGDRFWFHISPKTIGVELPEKEPPREDLGKKIQERILPEAFLPEMREPSPPP